MRKRTLLAGGAMALAACLLASGASATVLHITYKGTVVDGQDDTGEFNLAGQSLDGLSFTANYVIDTNKPGALHDTYPQSDFYYGTYGTNPVTASITLNGVTRTFGQYDGHDQRTDNTLLPSCVTDCTDALFSMGASNSDLYDLGSDRYVTLEYMNMAGYASDGTIHGLQHGPVNFTNPPVTLQGYVEINQYKFALGTNHNIDLHNAFAVLKIDSVVTAGVPEPASWALMIGGFGLTGASLRRRRLSGQSPNSPA